VHNKPGVRSRQRRCGKSLGTGEAFAATVLIVKMHLGHYISRVPVFSLLH
jgi:hypothetical protein